TCQTQTKKLSSSQILKTREGICGMRLAKEDRRKAPLFFVNPASLALPAPAIGDTLKSSADEQTQPCNTGTGSLPRSASVLQRCLRDHIHFGSFQRKYRVSGDLQFATKDPFSRDLRIACMEEQDCSGENLGGPS